MSTVLSSLPAATTADFEAVVLKPSPDRMVLVDFWAAWCGPCKALAPILEKVAEARADSLVVAKVDIDAEPGLAVTYGVRALPTMVIFRGGVPVGQLVGLQSAEAILRSVDELGAR